MVLAGHGRNRGHRVPLPPPGGPLVWSRPLHTFLLLLSVAGIIALTLTPTIRLGDPKPYCDIASLRPIGFDQLVSISDRSLNVLLFIPAGIALGLLPRSRAKAVAIGIAALAPLAIELTQAVATDLGRACEAIDVVDNLAGLAIGLVLAWLLTLAARTRSTRPSSGA